MGPGYLIYISCDVRRRICWNNNLFTNTTFQGDHLVIANVGDSRAVLATASDDGGLIPIQLTVDFKPNLPREWLSLEIILCSICVGVFE